MIILLPPSETKQAPASGTPFQLSTLTFPELNAYRQTVIAALERVSVKPEAAQILGVSQKLLTEVEHNTVLFSAPASRAIDTYTGVLYNALGVGNLNGTAQGRLNNVYVASALFGMVQAQDRIPAYRLSMKTSLPPLGSLVTWWKSKLTPVLKREFASQWVLDARSADYRRTWPGNPQHTATIDVVTVTGSTRKVVSHNAKHTRGLVTGHLLRSKAAWPQQIDEALETLSTAFEIEYYPPKRSRPASVTVVLRSA